MKPQLFWEIQIKILFIKLNKKACLQFKSKKQFQTIKHVIEKIPSRLTAPFYAFCFTNWHSTILSLFSAVPYNAFYTNNS